VRLSLVQLTIAQFELARRKRHLKIAYNRVAAVQTCQIVKVCRLLAVVERVVVFEMWQSDEGVNSVRCFERFLQPGAPLGSDDEPRTRELFSGCLSDWHQIATASRRAYRNIGRIVDRIGSRDAFADIQLEGLG